MAQDGLDDLVRFGLDLGPEPVTSTARADLERTYDAVIAGNEAIAPVEIRLQRKDGTQVPVEGLPTASATVAAGCTVIANDDDWCAAIAARELALYATSAHVAREARAREPLPTRYAC